MSEETLLEEIKRLPEDQQADVKKFLEARDAASKKDEAKPEIQDDMYTEFVKIVSKPHENDKTDGSHDKTEDEEEVVTEQDLKRAERMAHLKSRKLAKLLDKNKKAEEDRKLAEAPIDDYEAYGKRKLALAEKSGEKKI